MSHRESETARTVAANVKRLRTGRGWSTKTLARRLTEAGHPFSHAGVTRTERGGRNVTVDDLMALAVLFDVSPLALLLPMEEDGGSAVELAGWKAVSAREAWAWGRGESPLGGAEVTRSEVWRYQGESLPVFLRGVGVQLPAD